MFLLKDYNANKKSIQKELFVFLQAIEDSSGLKILVQYELEEAQRNQNKKKSTYKETSDIYSEWWQKKSLLNSANKMIEQLNILPKDLANYYEQYRIQKKTISTIKIWRINWLTHIWLIFL